MNLPRIYLIAILVLAFFVGANSQEPPKAVLVDEFDHIYCDEYLGRVDAFFAELMRHPLDQGLVVISMKSKNPLGYFAFTRSNIYFRQFNKNRIRIAFDSGKTVPGVQIWRIPPGANSPTFEEIPSPSFDTSKQFLFDEAEEPSPCPTFVPEIYANLIKENSGSYGKTIVRGPNWSSRLSMAESYVQDLRTKYGLSQDQLRVYYIHRPKSAFVTIEFWFVPGKKR